MTVEEKIIDVMKGMEGIGGIPSPEEYYVEFDMRVRAALGLVTDEVSSSGSVSDHYVCLPKDQVQKLVEFMKAHSR